RQTYIDFGVQPFDDVSRCACRRQQPRPKAACQSRKSDLDHGGHIGQIVIAHFASDHKSAKLPLQNQWEKIFGPAKIHVDPTTQHVRHGVRPAAVGYPVDFDSGGENEQFPSKCGPALRPKPQFSLPGLAFAWATSSCTERIGTDDRTTSTHEPD